VQHRIFILPALALSIVLGGCASASPNTQQGAVAGGALGAIAGAIVGNNSGSGNGASGAAVGAVLGAIAGGAMGNAKDQEQAEARRYQNEAPYQAQPGYTYTQVVPASHAPKPPVSMPPEEIPPSPNPAAIWIPGYWDYNGASYVWMPGRWEIPPHDKTTYVAAHWETRMGKSVFVRGTWE
jgi:hypothetical protein